MEIKSVDGRAKNYLQIRIQIDDAPIICILEPVWLDVRPESWYYLGSGFFLDT